jgi:hypothetical protein
MKTIFQILVILLVSAIAAGGVFSLVENTTLVSSAAAGHSQPSLMLNEDGTSTQPMEHGKGSGGGDEHGASFTRGMSELLVTLGKLGAISIIVLLFQSLMVHIQKRKITSHVFR